MGFLSGATGSGLFIRNDGGDFVPGTGDGYMYALILICFCFSGIMTGVYVFSGFSGIVSEIRYI